MRLIFTLIRRALMLVFPILAICCASHPKDSTRIDKCHVDAAMPPRIIVIIGDIPPRYIDNTPRLRLDRVPGFFLGEDGHVLSVSGIARSARNQAKANPAEPAKLYLYVEGPEETTFSELVKGIDVVKREVLRLGPPINLRIVVAPGDGQPEKGKTEKRVGDR